MKAPRHLFSVPDIPGLRQMASAPQSGRARLSGMPKARRPHRLGYRSPWPFGCQYHLQPNVLRYAESIDRSLSADHSVFRRQFTLRQLS